MDNKWTIELSGCDRYREASNPKAVKIVTPTERVKIASLAEAIELSLIFIAEHNLGGGIVKAANGIGLIEYQNWGGGNIYCGERRVATIFENGDIYQYWHEPNRLKPLAKETPLDKLVAPDSTFWSVYAPVCTVGNPIILGYSLNADAIYNLSEFGSLLRNEETHHFALFVASIYDAEEVLQYILSCKEDGDYLERPKIKRDIAYDKSAVSIEQRRMIHGSTWQQKYLQTLTQFGTVNSKLVEMGRCGVYTFQLEINDDCNVPYLLAFIDGLGVMKEKLEEV